MADATPIRVPPKILCPRCGEVTAWAGNPYRPFCSERCKLIDLGAWANEDYKVPGKPLDAEASDGDEGRDGGGNAEQDE